MDISELKTKNIRPMIMHLLERMRQDGVVLYGAGKYLRTTEDCLKKCVDGIKLRLVDGNEQIQGTSYFGIPVESPALISKDDLILIVPYGIVRTNIKNWLIRGGVCRRKYFLCL